jgi:hypothetical protein
LVWGTATEFRGNRVHAQVFFEADFEVTILWICSHSFGVEDRRRGGKRRKGGEELAEGAEGSREFDEEASHCS